MPWFSRHSRWSAHSSAAAAMHAENVQLAARSFRVVGTIVIIFQLLYLLADTVTLPAYLHRYLLFYAIAAINGLLATQVPRAAWFPRYWQLLALVMVGELDVGGGVMNMLSGTPTPHFYTIIVFTFGCATFLPWGVFWQSGLNLVCLATYTAVSLVSVRSGYYLYEWLALLAVLILSEFPAAFLDQYRRRLYAQMENLERALRASQAKSEFVASTSHELRNSLNTLLGMTDVLEGTELSADQRKFLKICRVSGDALLRVINDIIDLSRIEAGKLQVERAAFNLYDLVDDVADTVALRAHLRGLEVICSVRPGTPVDLVGDATRLQQVCLNLLTNAIKYTKQGQVEMQVERLPDASEGGLLRFCVADTGAGIAAEDRQRIFARFVRTDATVVRDEEGSGLGLAISQRLVEAMGGHIFVESELGKGSKFYFTCRLEIGKTDNSATWSGLALTGKTVLVGDDNATNREALRALLTQFGMRVTLCDSAGQVRAATGAAAMNYDALLIDSQLGRDSGIELAGRFAPRDRARTIVMLTRDELPAAPALVREARIPLYLLKPLRRAELLKTLLLVVAEKTPDQPQPAPNGAGLHVDSRALRILLAEDSTNNRRLIGAYLSQTPHQLELAENGQRAVEKFTTRHYDLVLVDLGMPVMDGQSAVRAMREWEETHGAPPTPIIAVSGRALTEDRTMSMAAGCDGYLAKPLKRAILMSTIAHFTS